MPTSFWESLRLGFIELRTACAINPPGVPAGRLTAIRDAEPTPSNWQLNYHDGMDGSGIAKRFTWHAQSAAARLGFVGEEAEALAFWLDRLLRDAPTQYLRKSRISGSNPSSAVVETIEILDVCGLSAEYCRKCEADEAGSQPVPKLLAKSRMPAESVPISVHGTSDTLAAADTTRSVSEPNREPAQRSSPENTAQTTAVLERPSAQVAPRKARGRPVKIPDELKERALAAKGGKERAKILYQTPYPSMQQVKNVSTILRHFTRKRQSTAE